jgi:hypothetical protein
MATSVDTARITYPESDGKPMADHTLQCRWMVTIQGGIDVCKAQLYGPSKDETVRFKRVEVRRALIAT